MTIYPERQQELSIVYWLRTRFPQATVVDEFPDKLLSLPTISVDWDDLTGYQLELGNRKLLQERKWYIDVFTQNKEMRKDFAYKIFNELQEGIPVLNYGSSPTPTQIGCLIPVELKIQKINPVPELVDEMYWRAVVILTATFDDNTL